MPITDSLYRMKITPDYENRKFLAEVINRETDDVVDSHEFDVNVIAPNLRNNVVVYGASKLYQDRSSEVPTGPGKLQAMRDIEEQFKAGVWTAERKGGGPQISVEVEALAEYYTRKGQKMTVGEAQSSLREYPKEVRDGILAHPDVAAIAAEIRKARAEATPVDLSTLIPADLAAAAAAGATA